MKYITFTNSGSMDLCHNMIVSLRRFTEDDIIVFCLDPTSKEYLQSQNISNITLNSKYQFQENYHNYGTQEFKQIMFLKLRSLIDTFNEFSDNLFFIDADVYFANSPCETIKQTEDSLTFDIVCQTDKPVGSMWCAGVMFLRNNESIKQLLTEAIKISEKLANIKTDMGEAHDQTILNHLLIDHKYKVGCFDTTFATNGHLYFSDFGPKERSGQSIIHANFCVGREQKIQWLKSENMWRL